jgi:hypothetical protein
MIFGLGKPNVKKMKKQQNIHGLIQALSYEKDDFIGREAMQALGEIGTPAVELLIT